MANYHYLKALDQNNGIFSHEIGMDLNGIQTPLNYQLMPAKFDSTEIRDLKLDPPPANDPVVHQYHDINEPIKIGNTTIQLFEVFHPDPVWLIELNTVGRCLSFAQTTN